MNKTFVRNGKKYLAFLIATAMTAFLPSCKAFEKSTLDVTFYDNVMSVDCGENYTINIKDNNSFIYTIKSKNDRKDIELSFYNDSEFDQLESEMMTLTQKEHITNASFEYDESGNGRLKFTGSDGTKEYFREVRYLKGSDVYGILDTYSADDMSGFDEISIVLKEIASTADHSKKINDLGNYMANYAGTLANTREGLEAQNAKAGDGSDNDGTSVNTTTDTTNNNFDESLLSEDAVRKVAGEFGYTSESTQQDKASSTIVFSKDGSISKIKLICMTDNLLTDEYYMEELSETGYDKVPNPVVLRVPDEEGYATYYAAMHDEGAILVIFTEDADECSKICARFGLVYNASSNSYDEITYGEEPDVPVEGTMDLSLEKYRAVASYFGIIDDVSETLEEGDIVGGDFMDGTTMSHAYVNPRYVQATYEEMLKAYGIQGPNPCVFKINSRFIVIAYDTSGNIVMVSTSSGTRLAQICSYFGIEVTKD